MSNQKRKPIKPNTTKQVRAFENFLKVGRVVVKETGKIAPKLISKKRIWAKIKAKGLIDL